jgi:hypothetical protein
MSRNNFGGDKSMGGEHTRNEQPDEKHQWLDPDNERQATVRFLVENTDLSPLQAEELVARHGADRARLVEIARTMKAEG